MNSLKAKSDRPQAVSVVVPVFNSQEFLPELVLRLEKVLPGVAPEFELILVNDGSRDKSWKTIQGLCQSFPWVRGINLMRNYGQHNALLCGIRQARHPVTITMDDDLQHPPEEIPKLMQKLAGGYDVVYGVPAEERHGLWRNMASQITKLALQAIMGAATARQVSAFRAFHTDLRRAFQHYHSPFVSIDVLLTWGATDFTAVKVEHQPRSQGKSNYTFRKLVTHAFNMMTGFSTLPLQFASMVGFFLTLFGVGVLAYVLVRYLMEGAVVPGFAFLASIIAIFSGAQLFAVGIIGEYLARIHFRTMKLPAYVVKKDLDPHRQG